jgi:hypothetical protein
VQGNIGLMNDRLSLQLGLRNSGIQRLQLRQRGGTATYNVQQIMRKLAQPGRPLNWTISSRRSSMSPKNFRAPPDSVLRPASSTTC